VAIRWWDGCAGAWDWLGAAARRDGRAARASHSDTYDSEKQAKLKAPPKIRIQTFISICSKEAQKNKKTADFTFQTKINKVAVERFKIYAFSLPLCAVCM